jgi:hypothetical protein
MRAWLDLLRERHPGVTWVPVALEKNHETKETVIAST